MRSADYIDADRIRTRLDSYLKGTGSASFYTDLFRWYVVELWMRHAFTAA
jgi:hypothetical protein